MGPVAQFGTMTQQRHDGLASERRTISYSQSATGASLFTYAGVGPFMGASSIVGSTLYQGDMAGNLYALTTG